MASESVASAAIASRVCVLLLAVGSDLLLPDHEPQDALLPDDFGAACRSRLLTSSVLSPVSNRKVRDRRVRPIIKAAMRRRSESISGDRVCV